MKTETKHTPGLWESSCAPFDMAVTVTAKGKQMDILGARGELNDEAEANIKLAAAAPELLEALLNLVADWERVHGAIPSDHEAKAAIAKATTEPSVTPSTEQESIASIILSNLFDNDPAYRTDCMECALEIIEFSNSKPLNA
jgi:hypothetical protein